MWRFKNDAVHHQQITGTDMRALGFWDFGGPDVLRVIELAVPAAAAGEIVVRVVAATVNPTDTLMRAGKQAAMMTALEPPYIAGMEFAGHVHSLGVGVDGFTVGQPVMGVVNPRRLRGGAHAGYVVASVPSLALLPDTVDLIEAATVPMNGLTALMIMELVGLRTGQSLLVTGAAGAVGGYVVQLAHDAGIIVLADARDSDAKLMCSLGADHIVPRGDGMAAAVQRLFPGGVDGLVDAAVLGARAGAFVRSGGVAVSLRKSNPINDPRLRTHYVSVLDQMSNTAMLARLADLLVRRVLTPRVAHRLPMARAAEAHTLVEAGGLRGRVVLLFAVA